MICLSHNVFSIAARFLARHGIATVWQQKIIWEVRIVNAREFEKAYKTLQNEYEQDEDNPQSYALKNCRQCASCHFCSDCDECYQCTHCSGLSGCSHCTKCDDCSNCHGSAYCVDSHNCSGSKYLIRCESCADCTYCFGCVGLNKKDFYILNEPYGRSEYFALVKELKKALGTK